MEAGLDTSVLAGKTNLLGIGVLALEAELGPGRINQLYLLVTPRCRLLGLLARCARRARRPVPRRSSLMLLGRYRHRPSGLHRRGVGLGGTELFQQRLALPVAKTTQPAGRGDFQLGHDFLRLDLAHLGQCLE